MIYIYDVTQRKIKEQKEIQRKETELHKCISNQTKIDFDTQIYDEGAGKHGKRIWILSNIDKDAEY